VLANAAKATPEASPWLRLTTIATEIEIGKEQAEPLGGLYEYSE
jgi:hypothetical protein